MKKLKYKMWAVKEEVKLFFKMKFDLIPEKKLKNLAKSSLYISGIFLFLFLLLSLLYGSPIFILLRGAGIAGVLAVFFTSIWSILFKDKIKKFINKY